MKKSFWDNSLFKKYSSISHNRLLTQLLSELKSYPIIRTIRNDNSLDNEKQKPKNKQSHQALTSKAINEDDTNSDPSIKIYSNLETI